MKNKILAAFIAVFCVTSSFAKKPKPPNALFVEITSVQWHATGYGGSDGYGHGNIQEAGQRHGFDFIFNCEHPFMATNGGGGYPGYWKKAGLKLIIEETSFENPNKKSYCELKTAVRPYTYEPQFTPFTTRPVWQ